MNPVHNESAQRKKREDSPAHAFVAGHKSRSSFRHLKQLQPAARTALPDDSQLTETGENMSHTYGYVRVSSADQKEDRQLMTMQAQSIRIDRIYVDKMSGKNFQRPRYQALVRRLKPGDLLCITSIDRLGRNYEEIQRQWQFLTKERKVDILVLDMPLLDTRRDRDLLGTFIADLVLQVLSFVAQNERENIRKRQAEGIAAAKKKGIRFGRPPRPLPAEFPDVLRLWSNGELTLAAAAKRCGMAESSFRYRAAAEQKSL